MTELSAQAGGYYGGWFPDRRDKTDEIMLIGCGAVGIGFAKPFIRAGKTPILIARGEQNESLPNRELAGRDCSGT